MFNTRDFVDCRNLVKNLLIGFLSSSTTDKSSVLRVFATVLEFDESEREKAGLNHPTANGGWFSGLLGSAGATPTKVREFSKIYRNKLFFRITLIINSPVFFSLPTGSGSFAVGCVRQILRKRIEAKAATTSLDDIQFSKDFVFSLFFFCVQIFTTQFFFSVADSTRPQPPTFVIVDTVRPPSLQCYASVIS